MTICHKGFGDLPNPGRKTSKSFITQILSSRFSFKYIYPKRLCQLSANFVSSMAKMHGLSESFSETLTTNILQ